MADRTLHVAKGLSLPLDAVTQTFGILARKGAGKTYTAAVFAEELIGAGLPVVILDPLGAFWGLRSSADGEKAGLPVTILGGEHGDVPLEPGAGKVIADLVVEQPGAYILDLSAFESNAAQDRFVTDFAERLYRLKATHREPLHLIVDEADSFAPQRPMPGQQRMLGAFEAIVRRGRIRGLGVTLITQRPAVLNKNVLTQIECLVVLQITGPQDRKAIDEWVAGNGTKEERDTLVASLAALQQGEAWFWSPAWLRVFIQAKVRRRHTFDSSRTPEPGEVIEPKRMAPVDLERLRTRMAAAIAKAKAEDPRELQARIRELERQLVDKPAPGEPEVRVERVEVPVLNGQVEKLEEAIGRLSLVGGELGQAGIHIGGIATEIVGVADDLLGALRRVGQAPAPVATMPRPQSRPAPVRPMAAVTAAPASDGAIGKGERAILIAVAQYPAGAARDQLSVLTGYKRSSRDTYLQRLSSAGYVQTAAGGQVRVTEAGIAALGSDYEPLPQGEALQDYWRARLPEGERRVFGVLVAAYPDAVRREQLDEETGYKRSSRDTYLQRLRSRRLVENVGPGEVRASEDLF